MKIQLSSIDQAPRSLPIWQSILADLADPPPRRIARVLGVSERTVFRWNQAGSAPRVATLALFWLTRWGRSQVDCQATNDARAAVGYAMSLQAELRSLRHQLLELARSTDQPERLRWLLGGLTPAQAEELWYLQHQPSTRAGQQATPETDPTNLPAASRPQAYTGWRGGDARALWNRARCSWCGQLPHQLPQQNEEQP
ncbi:hypothetical protein [Methylibium petroleiphilum]